MGGPRRGTNSTGPHIPRSTPSSESAPQRHRRAACHCCCCCCCCCCGCCCCNDGWWWWWCCCCCCCCEDVWASELARFVGRSMESRTKGASRQRASFLAFRPWSRRRRFWWSVVPSETFSSSSCSVVYLFHSILANIFDYLMREVHEGVDHSECMVISCQNE
jgi:hypothetical protein